MDDTTRSRARAPRHLRHPNLQPPWAAPVHRARSPGATDTSRYRSLWAPGGGLHSPNLRNRQTSPRAPRAHPGALPAAMAVQAVSANGSQPHNSAWACGRASPTAHPAPRPASRAPPPAPRAGTGCSLGAGPFLFSRTRFGSQSFLPFRSHPLCSVELFSKSGVRFYNQVYPRSSRTFFLGTRWRRPRSWRYRTVGPRKLRPTGREVTGELRWDTEVPKRFILPALSSTCSSAEVLPAG